MKPETCPTCGRVFKSLRSLGLHFAHLARLRALYGRPNVIDDHFPKTPGADRS